MFNLLARYSTPLKPVLMLCDRLCKGLPDKHTKEEEISRKIMSWKKNDAKQKLRQITESNKTMWRHNTNIMTEYNITEQFKLIWHKERSRLRNVLDDKLTKKIKFLRRSHNPNLETGNLQTVQGIIVADQTIDDTVYESTARVYGNSHTTPEENKVLALPPKFALYENIKFDDCVTEIETSLVKLRWDRRKESYRTTAVPRSETLTEPQDSAITLSNNREERSWPINLTSDGNTLIDFRVMRPTDFPFNKRVYLPEPLPREEEESIQRIKLDLMNTTREYISANRRNTRQQHHNLSKEEESGYKKLLTRSRKKEIVISQTDKSGRFTVDTPDNYREACAPHHTNDVEIDELDHTKAQKEINAHATMWTKILNVSQAYGTNSVTRSKNNLLVENSSLASLYVLRKDHKNSNDATVGPPCRPVCGASSAYNRKLSFLISKLIRPLWKDDAHVCCSSEEMLASIKAVNDQNTDKELIIGSADVEALYPSLNIEHTATVTAQLFYESETNVEGIDDEELGLYLALNLNETNLEREKVKEFCPSRRTNLGRPPTITGSANKKAVDKYKPWKKRCTIPNDHEKKKMLSLALKIVIMHIMNNHIYKINNQIKKQSRGGPIGLDLTGDLAQIYMTWFDKQLINGLNHRNIEVIMYQRYVDDINIAMIKPDHSLAELTEGEHVDSKLMDIVKEVGDNIHTSITLQVDAPSKHSDMKMPILDLKVWCESRVTNQDNIPPKKKSLILHEFYSKPMSSKAVMHAKSAFPLKTKRTVLTQELLRIFLRCSRELEWNQTLKHANEFMKRMQFSEHSQEFRTSVAKSAINAYNKIIDKDNEGTEPMYRPKTWRKAERFTEKRNKSENWFKRGQEESVLFVPATPKSELKKLYEEVIKKSKLEIKVAERGGTSLVHKLKRNDALESNTCECAICKTNPQGKGLCRLEGVVYCLTCDECGDKYYGETARNALSRIQEHMSDYKNQKKDSVMLRHANDKHHNTKYPSFSTTICKSHKDDALRRQITENVMIRKSGDINIRTDFNSTSRKSSFLSIKLLTRSGSLEC